MKQTQWLVVNGFATIAAGFASVKFLGGTTVVSAMDITISLVIYIMWIGSILLVLIKSSDKINSAVKISCVLVIAIIMGISTAHSLLGIAFILPFMGLAQWQSSMLVDDPVWFVILLYLILLIIIWIYVFIKRRNKG